jgi:hypothetical protein
MPNTVSGRAGQKWDLGDMVETVFWSSAPQIVLKDALGTRLKTLLAVAPGRGNDHETLEIRIQHEYPANHHYTNAK